MFNVSPITKALQEIHYNIPSEILSTIFLNDQSMSLSGESIDGMLLSTVIRPRVMVDCSLLGGRELKIDLSQCDSQYVDGFSVIYKIPKILTNGRSIISVLSLSPYNNSMGGSSCGGTPPYGDTMDGNNLLGMAEQVMGTYPTGSMGFNTNLELIGENTVLVKYNTQVINDGTLRVRVANEENMNNLQPAIYRVFSNLCIYAVKSYIHNKGIILHTKAELYGGQSLDSIRSYIDTLSDAEELYQDTLINRWQQASLINDDERSSRILNLMMPNNI